MNKSPICVLRQHSDNMSIIRDFPKKTSFLHAFCRRSANSAKIHHKPSSKSTPCTDQAQTYMNRVWAKRAASCRFIYLIPMSHHHVDQSSSHLISSHSSHRISSSHHVDRPFHPSTCQHWGSIHLHQNCTAVLAQHGEWTIQEPLGHSQGSNSF
jgi:hypothetical protein